MQKQPQVKKEPCQVLDDVDVDDVEKASYAPEIVRNGFKYLVCDILDKKWRSSQIVNWGIIKSLNFLRV